MSEPVRILIVEDSPTDFDLAQREIRKAVSECVFQQVQTRKDFLRELDAFQPDLILSDYQMPRFDGITALKLAQEHAKLTPFIIWTGTMGEDVAVKCMKAGAVNYILKENIKRLGPAVAHALEERRILLEHKQAEETIYANEKRFRALIENGQDNVSLLSADGVLLWESPATIRTLGYAQDEFVGQNIFELMHPDDLHWTHDLYSKLIQEPGSRQHGIFRLRHSDGTWRWNEAIVTNMLNEASVNAIVVNYRDITERKRAEDAVRESETRYRDLFENSPISLWEEDFSLVKQRLDALRQNGITDFREYFSAHPDLVTELASLVKITDANKASLGLFRAKRKEDFLKSLADILDGETLKHFQDEVLGLMSPLTRFTWEGTDKTVDGDRVEVFINGSIPHGYEENWSKVIVSISDITERKRMENSLRDREQRLNAIIENEPECIKILASDGSVLQMNPAGLAMLEADNIQAVLGKSVYPIVTAEYRQAFQDLTQGVFRGESGKLEFEMVGLKGTRRWLDTHAVPMRNEQGEVIGLLGITRDVTERRRAEEALRQSENRYRTVVENQTEFIVRWKSNGIRTFVNDAYCRYFGLTPEQALSSSFIPLIHEEDRQSVEEKISRLMSGITNVETETHRVIRSDGSIGWQEWTDQAIQDDDGQLIEFQSVGRDVTERKRAEEALHESEQRFRALFEDTPVAIWEEDFSQVKERLDSLKKKGITDFRAYFATHPEAVVEYAAMIRIQDVNNSAVQMFRAESKDQLIRSSDQSLSKGELEHMPETFKAIAEGRTRGGWEGADETLSGEPIEIGLSWSVALGYENDFSKVIVTTTDITERKKAEDALRKSEQQLSSIYNTVGDVIFHLAAEPEGQFRFTSVNPIFLKTTGLSEEMIIGRTVNEVVPEPSLTMVLEKYRQAIEEHSIIRWEETSEYPTGRLTGEVSIAPVYNNKGDCTHLVGSVHDITERKRADAKIRQYADIVENIKLGLYVFHLEKRDDDSSLWLALANPAALQFSGTTADEVIGTYLDQSFPELRKMGIPQKYAEVVRTGKALELEVIYYDDFQVMDTVYAVKAFPLPDDHVGVAFENITERKKAEDELRASEERFRQLADNIQEVFWITDPHGKTDLYISPAYKKIWGRSTEAQYQNPDKFVESVIPEDREIVTSALLKQKQGEKTEMEYRITRPDGSVRWIWDRAFPIFDQTKKVTLVTGIAADITERKQAEKETVRHLLEFEALYENGLAISRLFDPREIGNRIIETFERYLSWHHVTIRLRHGESDDLELVAFNIPHLKEEDKNAVERNFNAMVSKVGQGMSGWVVQNGVPIRAGNVHTYPQYVNTYEGILSGIYMPLKIGERIIGCISVESELPAAFTAQDERLLATLANQAAVAFENARLFQAARQELSERIRAEELLEHERNSLAQRVEERTADLSRANENLERALRVKDEFLANMSHELRTPLNAILGLSESLAEQVAGPLNNRQQNYITTISESGHHLLALINDILDLAKIEAGQITLDITKVDVRLVCQASLRLVKQLAQKKNQDIALEIDENFGLIWADERRLKQMIVNLLSNAVKFTPEGGRIGLDVHGDKDENRVLITVWDSGIGIEENDLSQLFQPFVQLDSSLARESSGTGLGLALVAQMARLHGGSVSVASMPGEGSRFTLVIPWQPALSADTIERMKVTGKFRAIKLNAGRQQTILLIEDTDEVILVVRDYLELSGYNVAVAKDGLDGITQAKLIHPDLILMDLQMPHMDGIEATQKLRGEPEFQYTPIIALTALAMPKDRERCLAAGMDEYISKPVNLRALIKIIQGFLSPAEESKFS